MLCRFFARFLIILIFSSSAYAEEALLFYWTFDEGVGDITRDMSGNGLDGAVKAKWLDSPSGKALFLDGTSQRIVKTRLPEAKRFGKSSWTFLAWVRPTELTIDDPQNQRRLFSFGTYPDANLIIDLTGAGSLSWYFCYKDDAGKVLSTGGSSLLKLKKDEWAHVAIVCDREAGRVWPYINGYSRGPSEIQPGFSGDFSLGGELTIGSGWHNYWGLVDEARVYRRALSKDEVEEQFQAFKDIYKVKESEEIIAGKNRERIERVLAEGNRAWGSGDYSAARTNYGKIVSETEVSGHSRSYAHLRLAQSYVAEGDSAAARVEYAKVRAEEAYPKVHRLEAEACEKELGREEQGLPGRDPAATRTHVPRVSTFAVEVFVSPDGNDANTGSRQNPLASLAEARNAVRAIKARGVRGAIGVIVLPGKYIVHDTLELTAEDSGTEKSPIIYRAEKKGQSIFYGGTRLRGFELVTDRATLDRIPPGARGKVVRCDLRAAGIADYGALKVRGFAQPPSPPTLELFFNGKPMTLARWPNKGFVSVKSLVDSGSRAEGRPSVFEYASDRHARWTGAEAPWIFGYFQFLWADSTLPIASIDTTSHTITTAEPYFYGGRGMSMQQGIIYYAFNLLEEIDLPGEWYLDRGAGVLYFYPPSDPSLATIEIGMLSKPMVSIENVSNLRIEELVFDLSRQNGIVIKDSNNCLVAGCVIRRMAGNGVTITGGKRNGILACDIHTIGRRATEVIGGDRASLTPGGHFVENCRIHNFGRIDRTYTPAIQLEGVGNRVAHNLMYDCPSSVMRIEGNDHLIEFNDVRDAVCESDDQGAMELFQNATYRGVVFRHNRFRDVGKTGTETAVHGQAAIRLDDAISGVLIYGNIFERSARGHFGGVQMNSGRDNIIDNNLFVDCERGVSGGWNSGNTVWRNLASGKKMAGFFSGDLYLSRYPEISHMLKPPGVNHLWRNVFLRSSPVATGNRAYLDLFENGVFLSDGAGFMDAATGDFRPTAPLFATVGFRPIPMGEIGLYQDEYRSSVTP